jgi:DNA (cytosine-5)-methyltransferase 1
MWPDTARIIREVRPRFCFLENVPGLLSGSHGYFGCILGDLAEAGYDARWCVLGADDVGAPHVRKRLWLFAWRTDADSQWKLQPQGRIEGERGWAGDMGSEVADSEGLGRQEGCSPERGEEEHARAGVSGWWSTEPAVGRVAHRVANRSHRLRAIGNGQCSLVAATAWRLLAGTDQ